MAGRRFLMYSPQQHRAYDAAELGGERYLLEMLSSYLLPTSVELLMPLMQERGIPVLSNTFCRRKSADTPLPRDRQ
jgi:hypothetical protein